MTPIVHKLAKNQENPGDDVAMRQTIILETKQCIDGFIFAFCTMIMMTIIITNHTCFEFKKFFFAILPSLVIQTSLRKYLLVFS